MALNARQRRFVDEYCIDLNATQAAIRSGYSKVTANRMGSENLSKPDIKAAIDAALDRIHTANTASAQEVEEYLTKVLRGESTAEIVVIEGVGNSCSNARCMSKAPDERERLKAAELLAKRHGMLTDKTKVEGGVQIVIRDDLDDD
jgi:phage terminase small subunit